MESTRAVAHQLQLRVLAVQVNEACAAAAGWQSDVDEDGSTGRCWHRSRYGLGPAARVLTCVQTHTSWGEVRLVIVPLGTQVRGWSQACLCRC
jgi:hypothetical protein